MRQPTYSFVDSSWMRHAGAASRWHRWMAGVARTVRALAETARAAVAARRQRQLARDTFFALHELDARTLRDLGFDRSEIASVACEVAGLADATRAHPERFPKGR